MSVIRFFTFARPELAANLCDALPAQNEWEIDGSLLFFTDSCCSLLTPESIEWCRSQARSKLI